MIFFLENTLFYDEKNFNHKKRPLIFLAPGPFCKVITVYGINIQSAAVQKECRFLFGEAPLTVGYMPKKTL